MHSRRFSPPEVIAFRSYVEIGEFGNNWSTNGTFERLDVQAEKRVKLTRGEEGRDTWNAFKRRVSQFLKLRIDDFEVLSTRSTSLWRGRKEKIAAEGEKEEKEATYIEPVPTWTREKP